MFTAALLLLLGVSIFINYELFNKINQKPNFYKNMEGANVEEMVQMLNAKQVNYRISDDGTGVVVAKEWALTVEFFDWCEKHGYTVAKTKSLYPNEMVIYRNVN